MSVKLLPVLLVLLLAFPAAAQTDTPVPTLTTTPAVTLVVTVPRSEMYQGLATAAYNVNRLPDDIRRPAGQQIVPSSDVSSLFSYAKWLFSLAAAQELLGETLAPVGMELYIILYFVIILTAIYFLVNLIVLIVKFGIWLVNQILKILPFW